MDGDYPRTLMELEQRFRDESACRAYLLALRWPQGFICPRCGGSTAWSSGRGLWVCAGCRHQVSVLAGTVFQDSKLPLTVWFRAMYSHASFFCKAN
jgi:ribosomal protein L37AE/L43A